MRKSSWVDMVFLVVAAVLLWTAAGGDVIAPAKPTAATYVYEKDDSVVPSPVMVALNQLNRAGIVATIFEEDTVNGDGETPAQYKVPLAAAKEAGPPALVVTAGDKVLRVVKSPKTAEEVLEAVK